MAIDVIDGDLDDQNGCRSLMHGQPPLVRQFASFRDEVDGIADYLRAYARALDATCLVARTDSVLERDEKTWSSAPPTPSPSRSARAAPPTRA